MLGPVATARCLLEHNSIKEFPLFATSLITRKAGGSLKAVVGLCADGSVGKMAPAESKLTAHTK
jgi:hypothetical protein